MIEKSTIFALLGSVLAPIIGVGVFMLMQTM